VNVKIDKQVGEELRKAAERAVLEAFRNMELVITPELESNSTVITFRKNTEPK
jgi:hypothetical protein